MKKPLFLISTIFIIIQSVVYAQVTDGCANALGSQIYYQRNGFGVGTGNTTKPRYDTSPFSTFTSNTSICPRFTVVAQKSPVTACCIGTDCGILNTVYTFTNIPCDLDDNTPILIAAIGVLGILLIRRKYNHSKKPLISQRP